MRVMAIIQAPRQHASTVNSLLILGAGMQGVAAAYDCAKFGDFDRILFADIDTSAAEAGSRRVNRLIGRELCKPLGFDATNRSALSHELPRHRLAISALPYAMHRTVEEVAIDAGCSVVDMGIDTPDALAVHALDERAKENGVAVVTDCGLAPGLVNVLAAGLLARCPEATAVRSYCGGLPETPVPPLGYVLRFSMDSVVGEYCEPVLALRDGAVVEGEPLERLEAIDFDGVGRLEAFTTSGGTGTAPYSFRGRVPSYEYKTLRYPGHVAAMQLFRDCGFWSDDPVAGLDQTPRAAFSAIMGANLRRPEIQDIVVVRVEAESPAGVRRMEMLEHQDPETGFTAMERLTGFSTAIVAMEVGSGQIGPGCRGCEVAVDPKRFQAELARRGFSINERAS